MTTANKSRLTLRRFVEIAAGTRPDGVGVLARAMMRRPPARWAASSLRRWAEPHQEILVENKLLEEFGGR